MNILSISMIAVFSVVLISVLKKQNPSIAFALSLCAAILVVLYAVQGISTIAGRLEGFTDMVEYIAIPVKALGITIMARFTTALCDDAGEKAISFGVHLFAKVSIVILALPLFEKLIDILQNIMEM